MTTRLLTRRLNTELESGGNWNRADNKKRSSTALVCNIQQIESQENRLYWSSWAIPSGLLLFITFHRQFALYAVPRPRLQSRKCPTWGQHRGTWWHGPEGTDWQDALRPHCITHTHTLYTQTLPFPHSNLSDKRNLQLFPLFLLLSVFFSFLLSLLLFLFGRDSNS